MSRRLHPPSRRAPLRVCLLVLALTAGVHADVESDYGRGWTAYKQGNWKVVLEAMTAAIAQRPGEQGRINIGSNNNQPYLPHYYLGLARFRLGNCAGALEAWQQSLAQGYVRKFRQENEEFSRYFPICEKQVEIETDLNSAATTLSALDAFARDPHLGRLWASDPGLGPSVTKANQLLIGAQSDYQAARQEREQQRVTALTAARSASAGARKQIESLNQAIRQRQQTLVAEARTRQQQQEAARVAALAANTPPPVTPPVAPPVNAPAVTPARSDAPPNAATSTTATTTNAGERGNRRTESLAIARPPEPLRTGIERFVGGRYRDALDALASVGSTGPWHAQAALFRAAASFSLYRSTREPQWRTRALDAARLSARLSPDLVVDEQLLSPAFRQFYVEATRGVSTTALPTR
jgi:hypothetical protein